MPRPQSAIQYCFTLNNYDEEEYTTILQKAERECSYYIIGKEVGDSGTPHLQGFLYFQRRCNFQHVRNLLSTRAHVETARGSPQQNRDYCSKGGDFAEGGELPQHSSHASVRQSRDKLATTFSTYFKRGNSGLAEFADQFPGTWYFSGHTLLRNALQLSRPCERPNITVEWFHGPPGTGKSREAHATLPDAYIKESRTKWWNGYLQEEEVIIDDLGPQSIDINHLLRWFDRYKCNVETKGGMVALHAQKFIVTSNFSPEDCFRDKDTVRHPQTEALLRRIIIKEF